MVKVWAQIMYGSQKMPCKNHGIYVELMYKRGYQKTFVKRKSCPRKYLIVGREMSRSMVATGIFHNTKWIQL